MEGYSPRLLAKIEYAGANEGSFAQARRSLEVMGELSISTKHIWRITKRLGRERGQERDAVVAAMQAGDMKPRHAEPPVVAAIHLDAGKIQLREAGGGAGVRGAHWADTKVGCFLTYTPISGDRDPQPEPPAIFLDPPRVMRLCREMERVRSAPAPESRVSKATRDEPLLVEEQPEIERAERLVRTAVATMESVEPFGWMVAEEAKARGFYEAAMKAVVGDGGNWIGPLADLHFPDFVQVLDFLHLLVHLYAAATAAYRGKAQAAWSLYEQWIREAWSGQAKSLIAGLQAACERLGPPPPRVSDDDPRRIASLALEYVKSNAHRMDYANYRRAGLPITSTAVESLIKQFNKRVKGTEQFWLEGGAEAILQVRAAYLSEDNRVAEFHEHRRSGRAVGRNRLRPAA
jgi:hypothetical protein